MSSHVVKRRKIDTSSPVVDHVINVLPPEVVLLICAHLSVEDKLSLRCVNKRMYSLLSSSLFWKEAVMDRYKRNNPLLVRTLLQLCSGSDSVLRYLQLPYYTSRSNISYVGGCKNLERLSWGGGVGFTAIGIWKLLFSDKGVCNFPHLTHLELNMKQKISFPFEHASNIPSLQHIVINDDGRCIHDAFSNWITNKCIPPLVTFVTRNILGRILHDDPLPPSACFSVFKRHKRPLNLPFYGVPVYNLCGGKVIAKLDNSQDSWPLIEISQCAGPDIFSSQPCYSYCRPIDGTQEQRQSAELFSRYSSSLNCSHIYTIPSDFINGLLSYCSNLLELHIAIMQPSTIDLLSRCCPSLITLNIELPWYMIRTAAEDLLWLTLSKMESLQLLIINDCFIPDPHSAIPPINIKALEITRHSCTVCRVVQEVELHSKFPSLHYLFIHNPIIKEDNLAILFESLTHLPHLVTLGIHTATEENTFPTTNFDHLYAQLENIYIYSSSTMVDIAILSKLSNLKQLAIAGPVRRDDIPRLLQTIPRVELLVVDSFDTYRYHQSELRQLISSHDAGITYIGNAYHYPLLDTELDRLS